MSQQGDARQSSRPGGWTVVELVVGVAIGVTLLGASLSMFHLAVRSRGVADAAAGLSDALLIRERIERDLDRLAIVDSRPRPATGRRDAQTEMCSIRCGARGARLSFFVFDPAADDSSGVGVRAVRYSRDPRTGLLEREYKGWVHPVGSARVDSLEFIAFASVFGPFLRTTFTLSPDPAGRSVTHSFLLRLPVQKAWPSLRMNVVSRFLDPADTPVAEVVPDL